MFDEFRKTVKSMLNQQHITYAQLGKITNYSKSSIAMFMCEKSNSRSIAEKIVDAFGLILQYSNGEYKIVITEENKK